MVNSKNEKVRKAGIALLIVLVIAGSITIIAINREKKENSYSNGENKNTNREINEDMIFIPLGISNKDRKRYELTQYINDVTTQNTQVLMEYSNESGITAYSYGNERLSYEVNGETYRYNYDGRGSVTNLLDNNNASVVQYNYKPFGETTKSGIKSDDLENTYQYNAESTDAITGLQYLRARYYDSETGRFISQDTYRGEITNPLSRNLYLYTNNDPVNYVDPSGHFWNEISNWGKSVVNGVKNAWNTTVQTVKNVGNAISNAVSNVVSTVKNAVSSVTNAVTNTVKNVVTNIKNVVNKNNKRTDVVEREKIASTVTSDVGYVVAKNTAAINEKAEQTKEFENQIKALRELGTPEAERMIEVLEEKMKITCESSLSKVEIQELQEQILESTVASIKRQMQRNTDHYLNGISHSIQTGIMGLTGLVAVPIANGIKFITGDQNYVSYEQYMKTVAELVDESSLTTAEDKDDVYYTGRADGEVAFFFIMYEYIDSISELARSNSSASSNVNDGNLNNVEGGSGSNYEVTWNKSINATQEMIEGTNIPKSFTMNGQYVNGKEVWVHGNATKHMGEYVNSANGSLLVENELMISFQDTVSQILPKVQLGRNFFYINGWEIGINGDTGVIYHALYK